MAEDRDSLRPSELKNLISELGAKAEKTPRPKGAALREVQAEQRRKTMRILVGIGIAAIITLVLFYFSYQKYMSQF